MSTTLQAAQELAQEAGFPVFPCIGKIPATPNGFKDATLTPENFTWEGRNIGVPTGELSNLIVVDVDKKSGGLESYASIKEHFPPTLTASTQGGGLHLYYSFPDEGAGNKVGLWPGVDIRGEGGYIIAPPSAGYEWSNEQPIEPCPAFLLDKLRAPVPIAFSTENDEVIEGGRNDYLAKLAGLWRRKGIAVETLTQLLHTENENKCLPPLDEDEVERIAASVSRYEPGDPISKTAPLFIKASDLEKDMFTYLGDKDVVKGTPTGIAALDDLLGGGKRKGEITAWHAEAKTGKNTIWHKLMHTCLTQEVPIPVGYASRELSPESEVLPAILSIEHKRNVLLDDLTEEDKKLYSSSMSRWPLYFADGYGFMSLDVIKQWVDALLTQGVEYFWFDHLHYMLEDPEDHKSASKLIKELKTLAKERNIHIDLIIQPNKLMEGQRLSLNSIKGGSAMGQAIDNLITIERVNEHRNIVQLNLKAARSRLATLGKCWLEYDPRTANFFETHEKLEDSAATTQQGPTYGKSI